MRKLTTETNDRDLADHSPSSDAVKDILQEIDKIPTLPTVVCKILEVVENPKSDVAELTRRIEMDQALTSRILKIVNSSFYGFPRQISTVSQAVVVLGFNAVKSLALSATVIKLFSKSNKSEFDPVDFWKHSIGTGVIANMVGTRIHYPLPEECLVAGILHGIGKLVFDQYLHEQFMRAIETAKKAKTSLQRAERDLFGMDHCEAGALLARKWKLPVHLEESIRHYAAPEKTEFNKTLTALVHLGDHVVQRIRFGGAGEPRAPMLSSEAMKILKIGQGDISAIFQNVEAELLKAEDIVESLVEQ